jgi:ribosome-associated protein
MQENNEDEEYRSLGRGRSAKKREAKAVEYLAQRLAELSDAELAKLPQEPGLTKEIELARNTRGHSSRKRQIKHLAGFLRGNEEQREEIEAALDGQAVSDRQEAMAFHHLENLRDRLCAAGTFEVALAEVRSAYPLLDDRKLARLACSVHDFGDKKAAREIFRRLRKAEEARDA